MTYKWNHIVYKYEIDFIKQNAPESYFDCCVYHILLSFFAE